MIKPFMVIVIEAALGIRTSLQPITHARNCNSYSVGVIFITLP
jgi:hypothetical protein